MKTFYNVMDIFIFKEVYRSEGEGWHGLEAYIASRIVLFNRKTQRLFSADVWAEKVRYGDGSLALNFENIFTLTLPPFKSSHAHFLFTTGSVKGIEVLGK